MSENARRKFLEKHKPIDDIDSHIQKQEKTKRRYTADMKEIEANLIEYYQREIPVINPHNEKVIALMRPLSAEEIEVLMPSSELMALREMSEDDLRALPNAERARIKREADAWTERQYQLLEDVILVPVKTTDEWKRAPAEFLGLVQVTALKDLKDMENRVGNF